MPENPIPATQPEAGAAAGEFNFVKPESESPRIKKRTLKPKSEVKADSKPAGLIKPNPAAIAAARELEREVPPRVTAQVKPTSVQTEEIMARPGAKTTESPSRVMPTTSVPVNPTVKIASTATPAVSPHGTRPATLYYSSPTSKAPTKAETPTPMKTIPTTSSASSSASAATPVSATRVTTSSATPRTASPNIDYRANVERQSREQKSVGSILSYVVYGLIAFFVISAALAAYGADVIFKQLHDQSTTVSELDQHYTRLTDELSTKLATTQDTLIATQAQVTRQQDLILKQQEAINQLLTASTANDAGLKAVKSTENQDAAGLSALRARVNKLEYKASQQKY